MAWSLTFTYEQELKSEYMNDILKGVTQPGVYNANMCLYTEPITEPGVHLKILAGTTLVFSNGKNWSGTPSVCHRDMDNIGDYVVKATATTDESQLLISAGADLILGETDGVPNAPLLFVGATYVYDHENPGSSSISIALYRPFKALALISALATLPNEDVEVTDGTYDEHESFLILGTIINTKKTGLTGYVTGGGAWAAGADDRWKADNVFTGKGLPDYSHQITRGYQDKLPDLIPAETISRFFFTSGKMIHKGISYNVDGQDWRTMYGWGDTDAITTPPTSETGIQVDYNYSSSAQTTTWSADPLTTAASKLYMTVVFAAFHGKQASSTAIALNTLLDSDDAEFKLLPITIQLDNNSALITDADDATLANNLFETGAITTVPLDVSVNNVARLKAVLEDQSIFQTVVDYMRRNPDQKPYLNSGNGNSLVPIFVGFRKTTAGDVIDDSQSLTSGGINPVNCLTLKDLQGLPQSNLINAIEDVFNIISVVE